MPACFSAGPISFVSLAALVRMKRLAGRPIDLAEIEKLEGSELDPDAVAGRLRALAEIYVAETVQEARARMRADAMRPDVFATQVARNLEELRALDELARYLHRHVRF